MACTGQTWRQIGRDWDLPRLTAWNAYSRKHPPLHLMIAAYLGVEGDKPKRGMSLDEFVSSTPQKMR
jgi:lambda repressor-like predicted transcriptional regulator